MCAIDACGRSAQVQNNETVFRVAVSYLADEWKTEANTLQERAMLGLLPEDTPKVLGWCDPIEDGGVRPEDEDPAGIPLRRHPMRTLDAHPELVLLVDAFKFGAFSKPSLNAYLGLSFFAVESIAIMNGARSRLERKLDAKAMADLEAQGD